MTDSIDLGRRLARKLAALDWNDIPAPVIERAKLFVLDTLGVVGGAARAPGIPELLSALREWEPAGGAATALLGGFRLSPQSAAMANGASSHALDFDDQHDPARIHAFCVVLPAALAASEARGNVSGKEFLTAVVLGVEIFCRLGLVAYNSLGKGWHPTTALGHFAAAAAAAKIFRLDAEQTCNALGLAFVQLGGTTQSIADGAHSKRLGPGFAARDGVTAAHLARAGLTGPWRFLEGPAGLFALHERGEADAPLLLDRFGEVWRLLDMSMKPYPCCRCTHTVIQIGLELHDEGIRPDRVESGEIGLGKVNWQIVGANFAPESAPNPVVHAQFNAAYSLARALNDGTVKLASFLPDAILAPEMALARRLSTVDANEIEPTAIAPARVELTLRDGTKISRSRDVMKGSPEEPMTQQEVMDKFAACFEFGLGVPKAESQPLAEAVLSLERRDDVAALVSLFPAKYVPA